MTLDARIEKQEVVARVLLAGEKATDYRLYLSAQAQGLARRERVSDVLNAERPFLPLKAVRDETVHLVNRDHVLWLSVPADLEPLDRVVAETGARMNVRVALTEGAALSGELRYILPQMKSRLSDFMEQAPLFFALWQGDRCTLIQKAEVVRVTTEAPETQRPAKPKTRKRRK